MKFIGIDLAWTTGTSGICGLIYQAERLEILTLEIKNNHEQVLSWLDENIPKNDYALIAVDAPTLIPNYTGMRVPDKLTHHYYHRYHAGCYPANLSRPFAEFTLNFGLSLEQRGFVHAPTIIPQEKGRYQIEVFPHPAMINLFQLERILKYKKGILWERQLELNKLVNYIQSVLINYQPLLHLNDLFWQLISPLSAKISGKNLKTIEDQLDALICAYVAAYWWYWGQEKNQVLGDIKSGYIVIPTPND